MKTNRSKPKALLPINFIVSVGLAISLIIKPTYQMRLLMTLDGGPFDSIYPSEEKGSILIGDQWDRAFLYNISANNDIGKFEGGHDNQFVEGVVEHRETNMIITVGTDGSVVFWDRKTNKTKKKIKNLAGKEGPLTDLIITDNGYVIVSAFKPGMNLFYCRLDMFLRGVRGFFNFESGIAGNITRLKVAREMPMFFSLSGVGLGFGGNDTMTELVLWRVGDPPMILSSLRTKGIVEFDSSFESDRLFYSNLRKDLISKRISDNETLVKKHDTHEGVVFGMTLIPGVEYIATAGGFLVKIWNKHLLLKESMDDSTATFLGRMMYKESERMLVAVSLQGLIIWSQCSLAFCQVCKNDNYCHSCIDGYSLDEKGNCRIQGSKNNPVDWNVGFTDIEMNAFRISFKNIDFNTFVKIKDESHPADQVKLFVGENNENNENFEMKFNKHFQEDNEFGWEFDFNLKTSLGMRNLSLAIENIDRKRVLSFKHTKSRLKRSVHFEPGPKKLAIPAMPSTKLPIFRIYKYVGLVYRAFYWLSLTLALFDLFGRLCYKRNLRLLTLIHYCSSYFSITFISFFMVNFRPLVTKTNLALHQSIHQNYFLILPELNIFFQKFSEGVNFFKDHQKISKYRMGFFFIDRFIIEGGIYFLLLFLSLLTCFGLTSTKGKGDVSDEENSEEARKRKIFGILDISEGMNCRKLINTIRFSTAYCLSLNIAFSACIEFIDMSNLTVYIPKIHKINYWATAATSFCIAFEIFYLLIIGVTINKDHIQLSSDILQENIISDYEKKMKKKGQKKNKEKKDGKKKNKGKKDDQKKTEETKNKNPKQKSKEILSSSTSGNQSDKNQKDKQETQVNDPGVGFFLAGSMVSKNMEFSAMNQRKLEVGASNINAFHYEGTILDLSFICTELSSSFMRSDYFTSFIAKTFHFSYFLRPFIILVLIFWLKDSPKIQSWIFLMVNFIYFLRLLIIGDLLYHRVVFFLREIFFLVLGILIVINAYDDEHPFWSIKSFVCFSLTYLVSREGLMLLEIYIFYLNISKAITRTRQTRIVKQQQLLFESYTQKPEKEEKQRKRRIIKQKLRLDDEDNKKEGVVLPSEERCLHISEIIDNNLQSNRGSAFHSKIIKRSFRNMNNSRLVDSGLKDKGKGKKS